MSGASTDWEGLADYLFSELSEGDVVYSTKGIVDVEKAMKFISLKDFGKYKKENEKRFKKLDKKHDERLYNLAEDFEKINKKQLDELADEYVKKLNEREKHHEDHKKKREEHHNECVHKLNKKISKLTRILLDISKKKLIRKVAACRLRHWRVRGHHITGGH